MAQIRLDTKVAFLSPVEAPRSLTGGSQEGWAEMFTSFAAVRYLRGGETVMESRMEGHRPAILIMRKRSVLNNVRLKWIVQFGGQSFHVRELPRIREDGATVEMMVEATL